MLKAVLFDLDGTIIDSNNAIFETYRQVSLKLNKEPPTIDTLRGLLGQPSHINLKLLFGENEKARPIYNEVVKKTHENHTRIVFIIGVRGFPTRGYFIPGRGGMGVWAAQEI